MKERGHFILWTPPYCPDLQPIELFWGIGKNWVASFHFGGRSMRQTVDSLRHGWYGNLHLFANVVIDVENIDPNRPVPITILGEDQIKIQRKEPIDCGKLVGKATTMINSKFIPLCNGLTGTIDDLVVDDTYEQTTENMPIDMLLIDLSASGDAADPIHVDIF
jgi:hypothetical protein